MKKFSRCLALFLAFVFVAMALSGCSKPQEESSELPELTIGVYSVEWNSYNYINWKEWLEYVGEELNIKFLYNTESADAEGEKSFIERMGAAGADGILATVYYNVPAALEVCAEYGMKYYATDNLADLFSELTEEQRACLVGSTTDDNQASREDRRQAGYRVAMETLTKLDKTQPITLKIVTLNPQSGIPPIAPPFLQESGVRAAVEELIAQGYNIDVEAFYPTGAKPADWAAATESALANLGNAENAAFITCTQVNYSLQSFVNAGMVGKVLFSGFGHSPDQLPYFEDGTITAVGGEAIPGEHVARALPLLYNAIVSDFTFGEEYPVFANVDTSITITSYEDLKALMDHVPGGEVGPYYTIDMLKDVLYIFNKELTKEDYQNFLNADPSGMRNASK